MEWYSRLIIGGKMKKLRYATAALIIIFLMSSCAGIVSLKQPEISGGRAPDQKYVPKKPPVKFEDFEAGTIVGGYSYANNAGAASAKVGVSDPAADKANSGNYCAKADMNTGTNGDWGCGIGFQSVYGGGYIDAKDREYLDMFIKAPKGFKFYVFVNEAQANGADGEYWNGPGQTGSGDWKEYVISMENFSKNIYSGNQAGNNSIDMTGIGTVGIQADGAQGKGVVLIDDVYFK
jgi:hypothetical protein